MDKILALPAPSARRTVISTLIISAIQRSVTDGVIVLTLVEIVRFLQALQQPLFTAQITVWRRALMTRDEPDRQIAGTGVTRHFRPPLGMAVANHKRPSPGSRFALSPGFASRREQTSPDDGQHAVPYGERNTRFADVVQQGGR